MSSLVEGGSGSPQAHHCWVNQGEGNFASNHSHCSTVGGCVLCCNQWCKPPVKDHCWWTHPSCGRQDNWCKWSVLHFNNSLSLSLVFSMLTPPQSTLLLYTCIHYTPPCLKSKPASELQIYINLPGDLGMSEKAKKQVVSTQCLAHHIFLEIYIPKSLVYISPWELPLELDCLIVCWVCKIKINMLNLYTVPNVCWILSYNHYTCSSDVYIWLKILYACCDKINGYSTYGLAYKGFRNANLQENVMGQTLNWHHLFLHIPKCPGNFMLILIP